MGAKVGRRALAFLQPATWALVWLVFASTGLAAEEPTASPALTPTPRCRETAKPALIHKVEPEYPSDLQKQGIQGVVILHGTLDADGRIKDITALESPSKALTELATAAFRQWRYKPALCDGTPVRVYIATTITFSLGKKSGAQSH